MFRVKRGPEAALPDWVRPIPKIDAYALEVFP